MSRNVPSANLPHRMYAEQGQTRKQERGQAHWLNAITAKNRVSKSGFRFHEALWCSGYRHAFYSNAELPGFNACIVTARPWADQFCQLYLHLPMTVHKNSKACTEVSSNFSSSVTCPTPCFILSCSSYRITFFQPFIFAHTAPSTSNALLSPRLARSYFKIPPDPVPA